MAHNDKHIDEGTLHAWLDGALSDDEALGVTSHVATCEQCSAATAEARGLIAASSRILTALDDVPAGVLPRRGAPWGRSFLTGWPVRIAAAVVFLAAGSLVVVQRMAPPPRPRAAAAPAPASPTPAAPTPLVPVTTPPVAPAPHKQAPVRAALKAGQGAAQSAPAAASPAPAAPARTDSIVAERRMPPAQAAAVQREMRGAAIAQAARSAPASTTLDQVVIPMGCFETDIAGLPARMQLADGAKVIVSDTTAFPHATWVPRGPDSVQIVLSDSIGRELHIAARVWRAELRGQLMSPDSQSFVRPFVATRCR